MVENELLGCPWGEEPLSVSFHFLLYVFGDGREWRGVPQDLVD